VRAPHRLWEVGWLREFPRGRIPPILAGIADPGKHLGRGRFVPVLAAPDMYFAAAFELQLRSKKT
jgi:hypothetical protein